MKKNVMAFGAFDGIHTGHIYYLEEAKKLGNDLIVAIARDKAVWKFPKKYELPENERKKLIEKLNIADKVILGSTTYALEKVVDENPDIIAITPYHPVDESVLQEDLKKEGLKTKVIVIKKYNPEIYDKHFEIKAPLTKEFLMGLAPKKIIISCHHQILHNKKAQP